MKPTLEAVSRRQGAADRTPVLFVAIVLVLAAAIGFVPALTGSNTPPSTSSSFNAQSGPLRSFQNFSQLQDFMAANAKSAQEYDAYGGSSFIGGPAMFVGGLVTMTDTIASSATMTVAGAATALQTAVSSVSSPSFTGTNVQVQGVDEPDIVKTDGTHLFVASASSSSTGGNAITIIQGEPLRSGHRYRDSPGSPHGHRPGVHERHH
jgi:uncharacterized secreted protein with C-terminal beta-propeller domain